MMATPEIKQKVGEEKGVQTVLAAMKAHPTQTGVQLNGCAAPQEMASVEKTRKEMKLGIRLSVRADGNKEGVEVIEVHPDGPLASVIQTGDIVLRSAFGDVERAASRQLRAAFRSEARTACSGHSAALFGQLRVYL